MAKITNPCALRSKREDESSQTYIRFAIQNMHVYTGQKKFSHSFAMNFVIVKRKELLWIVVLTT